MHLSSFTAETRLRSGSSGVVVWWALCLVLERSFIGTSVLTAAVLTEVFCGFLRTSNQTIDYTVY